MSRLDALDEALAELLAAHARLQREVALLKAQEAPLTPSDRALLARLLPVLGGEFGSADFLMSEARQRPSVRRVVGSRSTTGLGQLFARSAGQVISGYEIEKLGRHGSRSVWKIWRRPER